MGNTCLVWNLSKQTNDLPIYSINGMFTVKVVDVYDGDTITIIIYNKGDYEKHKLRMYGYDSPELHPRKNKENREREIELAIEAKNELSDLILDKIVTLECIGYDKYGRLLGTIYNNKKNINKHMIENKYGYEYYGKKKH